MLTQSVTIEAPLRTAYTGFADLNNWARLLPDVLEVQVLYDDVHHREFRMSVRRPNGAETVRGIWFCSPYKEIELIQPEPPPVFKRMNGLWRFEEVHGGTRVSATRWFELTDQARSGEEPLTESFVASKLSGYLQTNLRLFKDGIEAGL